MKKKGKELILWRRISAFLIDQGIIFVVIALPFNNFLDKFDSFSYVEKLDASLITAFIIILAMTFLYWVVFESLFRQTPGKAILGIFVRSTENKLNLWQIIIRNISKVSWILIFIDSIPLLFKKENQRYTEKLSMTEVFYGWK